jgi:tetratricopeptide (TPR) repeat protein
MTLVIRKLTAFAILLLMCALILPCLASAQRLMKKREPAAAPATATDVPAGPMTLWQARKTVASGFQSCPLATVDDPSSFKFTFDSFEFSAKIIVPFGHKDYRDQNVDLKDLPQVFPKKGFGGVYRVKDEAGKDLPEPFDHLVWYDSGTAELFANALNHLRDMAGEQGMALRNLPQAAGAWRALPQKPLVPEEVRGQRLLAETAFKERKLQKALCHYERGLELYPVWPEGRFNAALIAAELHSYGEAVEHMRAYLELLPDAPDAQSARDQVVIWQDKATETAAQAKNTEQKQSGGKKRR